MLSFRRTRLLSLSLICLASVVGLSTRALAEPPTALPTGAAVLEKSLEMTGGRAAFEKVKSRVSTVKMKIEQVGIEGTLTMQQTLDGNALMVLDLPGVGQTKTGLTDGVVWESSPMTGVRVVEGAEKQQQLRAFRLNAELQPEKYFSKIETVGREKVGDREAFKVVLTPNEGESETRYYDAENYRLLRVVSSVQSPMGVIQATSDMSDYKQVDGMDMPHTIVQSFQGMRIVTTMVDVKHNVEIDPSVFALPEDVKKLLANPKPPAPVKPAPKGM